MVAALFKQFDGHLARQGQIARGRQILDASIVPVPKNPNTRAEDKAIRAGEVPRGRADKPANRSRLSVRNDGGHLRARGLTRRIHRMGRRGPSR
jgi:hypothetical protein